MVQCEFPMVEGFGQGNGLAFPWWADWDEVLDKTGLVYVL